MRGENNFQFRGYASLRRFRESKPHADYFLTINLRARGRGLESNELTAKIRQQWEKLETEASWIVRTAVVMPDHIHLLVTLGEPRSVNECVRVFKGHLAPALRLHALHWQDGFFDHRIRAAADLLPVFIYIFLNPYRSGLIKNAGRWPGYYCCPEDWKWLEPMTAESVPQPEWLR